MRSLADLILPSEDLVLLEFENLGKVPHICNASSAFFALYADCRFCFVRHGGTGNSSTFSFVSQFYHSVIRFCDELVVGTNSSCPMSHSSYTFSSSSYVRSSS